MHRTLTASIAVSLGALSLCLSPAGCKAPDRPSVWETAFEPVDGVSDAPAPAAEVVIRRIDAETLKAEPRVTGFELIGRASLREERLGTEALGADGPLSTLARARGASLVLLSETPAGTEEREKLVRTRTLGGSQDITGGRPSTQVDAVPVMVPVEVYDYFILFYRTSGASDES